MASLGVRYWYLKILQCRYMENGLLYITFYVQKHMAPLGVCSGLPLVQDKPLGEPTFVKLTYYELTHWTLGDAAVTSKA